MVSDALVAAMMVKMSEGKSALSWVNIRFPAQQAALRTAVLATMDRCSASTVNDADSDAFDSNSEIKPLMETAAPTFKLDDVTEIVCSSATLDMSMNKVAGSFLKMPVEVLPKTNLYAYNRCVTNHCNKFNKQKLIYT